MVALFANKTGFVQIWGVIPIGIITGAFDFSVEVAVITSQKSEIILCPQI